MCIRAPKIAFSFNGGKDSTVVLHLLRAAVQQAARAPDAASASGTAAAASVAFPPVAASGDANAATAAAVVRYFYFVRGDDFEELDAFVRDTDERYGLGITYLTDSDFKRGLDTFISDTGTQAILLGTRRGDPNARDQEFFCPSSDGWPPFMRVNPILDWSYHDVWTFLRAAKLPYCRLYDQGYTSLGSRQTTQPNRALLREDGTYAPAYLLPDGRLERASRITAPAAAAAASDGGGEVGSFAHTAGIVVVGDELLSGKVGGAAVGESLRRAAVSPSSDAH